MAARAKKRTPSKKATTRAAPARKAPATRVRERVKSVKAYNGGGSYFTDPKPNLKFISSGCTTLDLALGGGWCVGRVVNVIGDKATGKTLLAIEACANFLRQWSMGWVHYLEAESAFDEGYARAVGMPEERVTLERRISTVEDFFDKLDAIVKKMEERHWIVTRDKEGNETSRKRTTKPMWPTLVVLDSLDALTDRAELLREMGEGSYGTAKAKYMGELFRRLVREMELNEITLFIISQVRDKIGVTYGRKWTRSGGRALDFYASQVVVLANLGKLYMTVRGQKLTTGVTVKAALDKNKVGLPYRECEFDIRFGYGVDDAQSLVDYLKSTKMLKTADILEKEVPGYLNYMLEEMTREEMTEELARLRVLVVSTWNEIQMATLPPRGKYD